MPVCLKTIRVLSLGPDPNVDQDGNPITAALVVDPANSNLSTCAYAAMTGAEAADSTALASLGQLASMTVSEALVIGAAVGLLWAFAWGFRQIARSIDIGGSKDETQDD